MVDLDVFFAVLLDCLGLRKSDCADFGVCEDYGGDVAVRKEGFGEVGWAEEAI